jgi:hypothetical protein
MFAPDVVNLRQFYASPFGEAVRDLIAASLKQVWPDARGDALLGIGYATPYLEAYLPQASPVMVCMPAAQGAAYWPPARPNLVFLAHESELPLPENSVNRVLLMHSVENSEQMSWMMREIWRVLTPGGRMLAIVPNRLGVWSRSSRSPFGYGRPFNVLQLRDMIGQHQFTLTRSTSALFIPPTRLRFMWRVATKIERIGKLICPFVGGVLMIEAEKQLYAAIRQPVHAKQGYRVPVPATNPIMGMEH